MMAKRKDREKSDLVYFSRETSSGSKWIFGPRNSAVCHLICIIETTQNNWTRLRRSLGKPFCSFHAFTPEFWLTFSRRVTRSERLNPEAGNNGRDIIGID